MKIEEAKEKIEEHSWFSQDPNNNEIDIRTVFNIIDQIETDQQKPVVPQCVIDWVNDSRESGYFFEEWFDRDYQPKEVREWLNLENKRQADINALALVTLIVDGPDAVTVEKEKLYTVEIPNPNTPAITVLARPIVGDVRGDGMSYFVGQEIKLRGKIIGHSHSFSGGNDKYTILIKPGSVIEIDKPVLESIAIG